jgi:2-amino-4-hydroxy-6-hydroxymethyldihydropteridine diphosphokinase
LKLRVVVGLGANMGDRLAAMRAAVRELGRVARVQQTSRPYATAPVGSIPQPEFLNAASLILYEGEAVSLLDELLAIEKNLGRVRKERWGPRTIDLDILWIDGLVVEVPRLIVPHPLLQERAFALVPMLELVPDATDPRTGRRYAVPPGDVRATADVI